MVQKVKFWDKLAAGYAKSPIKDMKTYQEKLEITRRYLQPDSDVFEFACGTGTTAVAHASYVKNILAIDISSSMLEIAKEKAAAENIENINFEQSTIEEFSAAAQSFDVVMGHSILHLLENPEAAIDKVYNLLKPGGVFVSSTVCLGDSLSIWRLVLPLGHLIGRLPYVNCLARKDLDRYFINSGFEIDFQWERSKKQAAFIVARKPVS